MTRRPDVLPRWLTWLAWALAGLVWASIVVMSPPAYAQTPPCAPHEAMRRILAERWGETRTAIGLDRNGAMVEVWASLETGTWTITVTGPGGLTCIASSGAHFEMTLELPPNTDPGA